MGESKGRVCIVSSPSRRFVKKILKRMKGKKFWWVYFGEDVLKAVSIDTAIRDKGQRFEIAGLLQEAARSLRQPYIDYIGKLSREKNSLRWWASSLSEKSPFNSKTFLHACYIRICMYILKKYPDKSFVFFIEKGTIRRALLKNMPVTEFENMRDTRESISEGLEDLKKLVLHKGWFLLSSIYYIFMAKYVYRMRKRVETQKQPLTLIFTWVDRRSFDKEGVYRETYFGKLPDYLKTNGKNVAFVSHVLGTASYREILDKMAKSENVFLVPHAFLSISDVVRVFFATLGNMPKKTIYPRFEELEISDLIHDDLKNSWSSARVAFDLLLHHFVRRLKERHVTIDTAIYPFENQTWEKVLCTAMRRFYPSTYLIAYQHSTVYTMLLNYFFSKQEIDIIPFPDKVITNGRHPKRLFIESGYPAGKVVEGGAIRYEYLLEAKASERREKGGKPLVLVAPSISESEAIELIWKVLGAFESCREYRILIKCHPDMPFGIISKRLNVGLPAHFTLSDKPVAKLLKETDVLLYTSSTTSVEAMAAGIPVVHVASDFYLDLDPLDFSPEARPCARNPGEIVRCVDEAIAMDEEELSVKRKSWDRIVSDLFGEVDESVYRLFLR